MYSAVRHLVLFTAVWLGVAGCATKAPMPVVDPATTRPADDPAFLALEQIEPRPVLPAPTTAPSTQPAPLDAIELFAKARGLMISGQHQSAIHLLNRSISLDAASFELHYTLGQAQANAGELDESIVTYQKAAQLRPDHLDVHLNLARQHLMSADLDQAIEQLRLAQQTSQYGIDSNGSQVTDFLLARSLQQKGYNRAAIDLYNRVFAGLRRNSFALRDMPEIAYYANHPDALLVQIGELHEKNGQFAEALAKYEAAVTQRPRSFDYQSRAVHAMLALGRHDAAARRAADIVRQFRAAPDSLRLLREAYRQSGGDEAVVEQLEKLHQQHPRDRAILFALVDVLTSLSRADEAQRLLWAAVERGGTDIDHVRRLFTLLENRGDVNGAAKLLIESLAQRPDSLRDLAPLWNELIRPSRSNRLRLSNLQQINVSEDARAAKLFWVSRVALALGRDVPARAALHESVQLTPPFAPAYRVLISDYWARREWDSGKKTQASQELIDSAQSGGDEALVAELRGLLLVAQKQPREAIEQFALAQKLGGKSIDLKLGHALALRAAGQNLLAEQALWKLAQDQPRCDDAYAALFRYYLDIGSADQAMRTLNTWTAADPSNLNARLLEATIYFQAEQFERAEVILVSMFDQHPEDRTALLALREFYTNRSRLEEFVRRLEAQRIEQPENHLIVEQLIDLYASQKRDNEASRVLESLRAAVADDPDLLYYVANLYTRIGQEKTTEQILSDIVTLDPLHAPASNDLGYNWADQGKNLDRAEQLIRVAVQAEPDNQSFLDSLGWVLYKRGRFDEALKYLRLAIEPASFPDPVVLDHLGDTLYRLGKTEEAAEQWQQSWERLAQADQQRPDIKQLKLQLQQKLKQSESKQPVNVAPIVEAPTTRQQAKN